MLVSRQKEKRKHDEELRGRSEISIGECIHPPERRFEDQIEGLVTCMDCGVVLRPYMIDESIRSLSQKSGDFAREIDHYNRCGWSKSVYSRKNHLIDYFQNIRAIKTPQLQPIVVDTLQYDCDRYRLETDRITPVWIRFFLRTRGWISYYEFVPYFVQIIQHRRDGRTFSMDRGKNGNMDCLTDELETRIMDMMTKVESVYSECRGNGRKNFFSMSFFVRKCLELLGEESRAQHFKLPKTGRIRAEQERTWYQVCQKLKWPQELNKL